MSHVRRRAGLTLIEVIVALGILGGVLLGLGMFSVRLSMSTSNSRLRVTAAQLASAQLEAAKGAPSYASIESLFVKTEVLTDQYAGYSRQTWVNHIGGRLTDSTDYKVVTVQVTNSQMAGNIRKTTVIAPF